MSAFNQYLYVGNIAHSHEQDLQHAKSNRTHQSLPLTCRVVGDIQSQGTNHSLEEVEAKGPGNRPKLGFRNLPSTNQRIEMQRLEYNEDTNLYFIGPSGQAFSSASEALWSAFFTRTSFAVFEVHAITMIVLERAACGYQSAHGINHLAAMIRLHFYGYLRAVCEADDEEADETCSMINFNAQASKVWESALLKLAK